METYAWPRATWNQDHDDREYIQDWTLHQAPEPEYEQNQGYCTNLVPFYDNLNTLTGFSVFNEHSFLTPGEIRRYSILIWLAGDDADSIGRKLPKESSIRLKMTFQGEEAVEH